MELRQLKYFAVLSDELNFSHAADRLYITQGTLSQQLKQLENEIGSELFQRTSHSVRLTEAGEELLPFARKTLEAAKECMDASADLQSGLRGELNIGVTHSFKYLLRSTVKDFLKNYPGVKLKIHYGTATELLVMLRRHQIDIIVSFQPETPHPDIITEELFHSTISVIMRKGHPLSSEPFLTFEQLQRHPIVLPAPGLQSRKAIERCLDIDTAGLKVRVEINDPTILLELVSATNLLGITSTLAISYRGDLVAVPLKGVEAVMTGCVHSLAEGYRKRSSEIFTRMLVESAEVVRMMEG